MVRWLDDSRFLSITASSTSEFNCGDQTQLAEPLGRYGTDVYVQALAGSPDGLGVYYIVDGRLSRVSASGEVAPLVVDLPIDSVGLANVAVSPDDSFAAVLGMAPSGGDDVGPEPPDVMLLLVSLDTGRQRVLKTYQAFGEMLSLAITPDSRTLAFVSGEQEITQFDAVSGRQRGEPAKVPEMVTALQYSADGGSLLIADFSGAVRRLDLATGKLGAPHALSSETAPIRSLALTPREDLLIATTDDGQILFGDPQALRPVRTPISAGSASFSNVAVSHDGSLLAALDGDGSLRLWNLQADRSLGPPLRTDSAAEGPVFLRNDHQVVTDVSPGGLLLWSLDPDVWRATACALAGRELSRDEWARFLGDEPYRETCSNR